MPRSIIKKIKKFREFSRLDKRYVKRNYMKHLRKARAIMVDSGIPNKYLDFMLWCYDLEFFTIDFAAETFEYRKSKLADRVIYPMVNEGLLYKHFDKLTPSGSESDYLFRDETKFNYRVRYALTQKGRLHVQRFYRLCEGLIES